MKSEDSKKEILDKMLDGQIGPSTMHNALIRMAETSFRQAAALNRIHKEEFSYRNEADLKALLRWTGQAKRKLQASIATITFCAMSLESYINYYLSHITSEEVFESSYRWGSVEDKWLKFPKQLKGIVFEENSEEVRAFRRLVRDRNEIFHDVSRMTSWKEQSKHQRSMFSRAENANFALRGMIRLLDEKDPPVVGMVSGLKVWKRLKG